MAKEIKLANHIDCTGCGACLDACPTNSISFITEGLHEYPAIADTCIQCGKCMKVCPILNKQSAGTFEQNYYCAWNKDAVERHNSTSGGAGSAMATHALQEGFFVCGAEFDGDWHLKHEVSQEKQIVKKFSGSKYLKSDTLGIFNQVKSVVDRGERLLFTGTPCQCDAILHFLNDEERKLLVTVSILCHGVNSPLVWKDYVDSEEKRFQSKLKVYNFRSKSKGWREDKGGGGKLRVLKIFENGKRKDVPSWNNLFHCWFGHHYILRPSCFRCPYRCRQRLSDITIGDFWGLSKVLPRVDSIEGASVVITSTEKGEEFLHRCHNLHLIKTDSSSTEKVLKGFVEKRTEEKIDKEIRRNKEFENEYMVKGFPQMAQLYPAESYLARIIASLKSRLHI